MNASERPIRLVEMTIGIGSMKITSDHIKALSGIVMMEVLLKRIED